MSAPLKLRPVRTFSRYPKQYFSRPPREPLQIGAFLRRWWAVLLLVLSAGILLLVRIDPSLTDLIYSRTLYPLMAGPVGALASFVPFSIAEITLVLFLTAVFAVLVWGIIHAVYVRLGRAYPSRVRWGWWLLWLCKLGCVFVFVFAATCAPNYYRLEFSTFSGLEVRDSTSAELEALCTELTERVNALRQQMPEDSMGVMRLSESVYDTAHLAQDAFAGLSEKYAVLPVYKITPKPVLNSWWMSMMQITGEFSLFTFEANINKEAPDHTIPATMGHELAHTRGFMREDEANFIGYLACLESDSPELQYSGLMLALIHANNRLYGVDYEAFLRVNNLLSDGVRRDFSYNNDYWARFEGPVAEVSDAMNNAYLKVNNQQDGSRSYGRMVDLLLADYRTRHGLV